MNWSGRRVEIKLLAISFVAQNTVLVTVSWRRCASKVEDFGIAAFETASDLSVQLATKSLNFVVFVLMLTAVIHVRCPYSGTSMCAFFGMKTQISCSYLRET
jgi:hypothetical protein